MKYALIENNVVIQIGAKKRDGFIEAPDYVACGMVKNGDSYSISPKSNDELFTEEMAALNAKYESDTQKAINKVASAMAWDGVTESVKVANARAELAQLKTNYDTQSLAIINKYYGA